MDEFLEYNHDDNSLLKISIRKAELLLAYSAEKGIMLDEEDIKSVIDIKDLIEKDSLTQEATTDFWLSYNIISRKIKPVSISSILASKEIKIESPGFISKFLDRRYHSSLAHVAVRRYMVFAVISMIVMLVLQIYALKGTTLLDSIHGWEKRQNEIEERFVELEMMTDDEGSNLSANREQSRLLIEIDELGEKINSSIILLESWLNAGSLFVSDPAEIATKVKTQTTEEIMDSSLDRQKILVMQEAINLTLILGLYILPLLYGLLGGVVFVLRVLVEEVKELVFSKESTIKYTLRILLGAIFGLSIGLFWDDVQAQQTGFVASLSLLFVAFITGYSVEYLFFLIDRIAGKIIGQRTEEVRSEKK